MLYGFGGTTLRIDLDNQTIEKQPTDPELARQWLGARGMVAKTLYDEVPRDADPFGPENRLVMAPGVLTGSYTPSGSKIGFGAISPLSNGHGDSSMGGHLGPTLKFAGYDLVVVKGISAKPVFLLIDDDTVELRDASAYWGMGSLDLEKKMKEDLGHDFEIATIGPAAENKVRFSCITHDFGRNAGRCGIGAVMGSKRLKAIAVRGSKSLPCFDLEGLTRDTTEVIVRSSTHENMEPWQKYGTAFFVKWSNQAGVYPTRNFRSTYFEDHEQLDGDKLLEHCRVSDKACFGCWMNCGKYSKVEVPGRETVFVEGPEYETLALCGGNLGMTDIRHVAYINYVCDNLGMDTMSGGSVVGFAMECYERGYITKDDLDGHELTWGNLDAAVAVLHMVAERRGIGAALAEGTKRAAETIGHDSQRFAMQVKGQEMSGYDGRWAPAMLLSYMTSDIGAHHNRAWTITMDMDLGRSVIEDKAKVVVYLQHIRPFFDTASICRLFWGEVDITPEEIIRSLQQLTGWDIDLDEAMRVSERIWNLNRCHYLERNGGPGRQFDVPPARQVEEKIPSGPGKGAQLTREQMDAMLDEYYRVRCWDEDGNPTRQILDDLSLSYAAENLEKIGMLGQWVGELPEVRGERYKPKAF